ncbi:hypothetical protein F2Q68_00017441 [Brassica cretica]|uniref:Uncharacterized protein n=1 Tax=Brassica cretica TaxID=69181 RepID=A0A8S9HKN6_BRACR|nr:hypothetical protein F2Q68_00017441 [Brassica cretica]
MHVPNLLRRNENSNGNNEKSLNAQADPPSLTIGTMKRPRSPLNGRHSPNLGRHRLSSSNQPQSDYRREEKRQKLSTPRENRAYRPYQKELSKDRESSYRDHPCKDDVWRRLELPPRASSAYGNGKDISSNSPHREIPYSQKNRWPKQTESYRGRYSNHRHRILEPGVHVPRQGQTLTLIWRQYLPELPYRRKTPQPELSQTLREPPTGPPGPRRSHITDTPTSRDREPCARSSSVIIRDPENRHQTHQHTISLRPEASSPGHKNNVLIQLDLDIDLDLGQDSEITLTEDEITLADSMVMEIERLEMDAEMLDNDDLLDEMHWEGRLP